MTELTDQELLTLAESITGFDQTRFEFQRAHTEDHGIGHVADFVRIDDRLVAVTEDIDDPYVIADDIEEHVALGLVTYLNAAGPLAKAVKRLITERNAAETTALRLFAMLQLPANATPHEATLALRALRNRSEALEAATAFLSHRYPCHILTQHPESDPDCTCGLVTVLKTIETLKK